MPDSRDTACFRHLSYISFNRKRPACSLISRTCVIDCGANAMTLFLERFLLPLFVAGVIVVAITNPMGLDKTQRIVGAIILVLAAYFVAHTVYKTNHPQSESDLSVYLVQFINPSRIWVVRGDIKQYLPIDIFMMMRITNLAKDEFSFDSVTVQLLRNDSSAPVDLFLVNPSKLWVAHYGFSPNVVVPCTFDRSFIFDALREPLPAGRTIHTVALFQIPKGTSVRPSGVKFTFVDTRGRSIPSMLFYQLIHRLVVWSS